MNIKLRYFCFPKVKVRFHSVNSVIKILLVVLDILEM